MVRFFERSLRHTKGPLAGLPFSLDEWQALEIVGPLFGSKREDGTRKFRSAYIEVAKKQGKSQLASGIALYLLVADGEGGPEVASAAVDTTQAGIVFDAAKAMAEASPLLSRYTEPYRNLIRCPSNRGVYRVYSADAKTKHGANLSGCVYDELHAVPSRELFDTLKTATAARRQPLFVMITTAGDDMDSENVCHQQHEYARGVLDGRIPDESFFAYIRAASPEADWRSEETWRAANPGLGVSVSLSYLREEAKRAEQIPAYEAAFRRFHLCQWVKSRETFIPLDMWDASAGNVDPAELEGRWCYGGLDTASTVDLAAFILTFPPADIETGNYKVLAHFFIPADNAAKRSQRDGAPYLHWIERGLVTATPGDVISYAYIIEKIRELSARYIIRDIGYDRWEAAQLVQELSEFTWVPIPQTCAALNDGTRAILNLAQARRLHHGGNDVLRWMSQHVTTEMNAQGQIKPSKKLSKDRIDGIVALAMSLDRCLRNPSASVYETRGILSFGEPGPPMAIRG